MCGIAVFLAAVETSLPQTSDLQTGLAALAHRGPDDQGIFVDPNAGVALCHARLSILDLSPAGHQPMPGPTGETVIVFNGEIYNFRELRAELETTGHTFKSQSDTEVLLHLYEAHGSDMLSRLNGIFAFAIWDSRQEKLLVARDALGVKPLYFTAGNGLFAAASEIKSLQAAGVKMGGIDHAAIQRYLTFLWCPGEGTPARAIKKLNPGEAMWVRRGNVESRFTWYRLPSFRVPKRDFGEAEAVRCTTANLRQAVHRQMVADVPVGAFLSGGLDSSSVVALAREVNPQIHCFTIEVTDGQDAGITDDLPYAERVAAHLNVPLEKISIDASLMARDLEAMVAQLDEPLADPAPLNVLYISRRARERGQKVLLSGAGGDDIFTGYRRHQAMLWAPLLDHVPAAWRRAAERLSRSLDQRKAVFRKATKLLAGVSLDGDARLVSFFAWARRSDLEPLYTADFRQEVADSLPEAPLLDFLAHMPSTASDLDRMLALEQRFFLADHNLIYTDKMSMAAGIEVRVPFLDLDLVEFAATIPDRLKLRGKEGKWVLKKAMEPFLPRDVIYRPKSGFGAPLRRWIRHELRDFLLELLSADSLRRRGLFDPAAVHALIARNDSGAIDASYTILSLMCIEIWCRTFLDCTPPERGCGK